MRDGKTTSGLFWYLPGAILVSILLGVILSLFFLVSVSREIGANYRNVALTWVKACQHEMSARGELGLLQQEMELNSASLKRQGIEFVEVVSHTGLILMHSDEDMVGETLNLTLTLSGALKGTSNQRLTGLGSQTRVVITEPLSNYGQIWGALVMGLSPEKKHVLPLRLGSFPPYLLFLLLALDILLLIFFVWKTASASESALTDLRKKEDTLRDDQLATVGAGLAHEVKNALNGISLNAQLLREDLREDGADEKRLRKLERIEKEASSSGEMLAAFLDYAKNTGFSPKEMNPRALIKEIGQYFKEAGERQNAEVAYFADELPQSILADENSLRHAVTNLMWNAVQAVSGEGGGHVVLKGERRGKTIVISVQDDGPGIPREKREKIFEAFYTTKEKGAGLGLAVARKAAREHGGKLEIRDCEKGCLFVLSIPVEE